MKKISYESLHNLRKKIIEENKDNDHIVFDGQNNILISAPHGVSQIRLGKYKPKEIGSLATALHIFKNTNCYLIAKTKNNNDDANFDEKSDYKDSIKHLLRKNNIKYIIDIHGLSSKRQHDINLGIHLGKNIETNVKIFNDLCMSLKKNNFTVSIDQPFMAGSRTISGGLKNQYNNIWTIQIEINCSITNKKENFNRYKSLLNVLVDWISSIH